MGGNIRKLLYAQRLPANIFDMDNRYEPFNEPVSKIVKKNCACSVEVGQVRSEPHPHVSKLPWLHLQETDVQRVPD